MNKKNNYAGGLSNYIVLKKKKEVIFLLRNPRYNEVKFS